MHSSLTLETAHACQERKVRPGRGGSVQGDDVARDLHHVVATKIE